MASSALLVGGSMRASVAGGLAALSGLTKRWSDPCSASDPLVAGKFALAPMQTGTGLAIEYPDNLSSPHAIATSPAPRFQQFSSGGASGAGYYRFFAPQGDDIYTSGGTGDHGRSSIDYPKWDPGSTPTHDGPSGAGFFFEGRRYITMLSTRLVSPWNLNVIEDADTEIWRVLAQWKQNEWIAVSQDSPQLSFQQRSNDYIVTANDDLNNDVIVWNHSATGTVGSWLNWAFDINFSQSAGSGSLRVYGDLNNDGTWEYDSGAITGIETLCPGSLVTRPDPPRSYASEGVESMFSIGVYEGEGGDKAEFSDLAIWG